MGTPKPPVKMLVDSFEYKEYLGDENWGVGKYAESVLIELCRIDKGTQYSATDNGKQVLYNALILCYSGITEPFLRFKEQSKVVFDGVERTITKVVYVTEVSSKEFYSIELEVI